MSTTSLSSIQPQVLEANLKRATVPTAPPVEEPVAEPAGALASAVGAVARVAGGVFRRPAPAAAKLSPQGVPHGAVNVPVRMRNVRICNNGRGIAYCNSFGYEALAVVPKGDGMPYPTNAETFCDCTVPRDGEYDAETLVTVNGAMSVRVKKLTPVCT